MSVISERKHRARAERFCDECRKPIRRGETYWRLYGFAMEGDPKYNISLHVGCYTPKGGARE